MTELINELINDLCREAARCRVLIQLTHRRYNHANGAPFYPPDQRERLEGRWEGMLLALSMVAGWPPDPGPDSPAARYVNDWRKARLLWNDDAREDFERYRSLFGRAPSETGPAGRPVDEVVAQAEARMAATLAENPDAQEVSWHNSRQRQLHTLTRGGTMTITPDR